MTTSFDKFRLLMWKNWLLQWRHPKQTAVEILAPVLFSALLVLIRSLVDPETHPNPVKFEQFSINLPKNMDHKQLIPLEVIYWSPKTDLLEDIMEETRKSLGLRWQQPYDNSAALVHDLENPNVIRNTLCGVIFDDSLVNATVLPENINLVIRFPAESRNVSSAVIQYDWRTNFLFPLYQIPGPRNPQENDGGYPAGYYGEGFLAVQHFVSRAITNSLYPNNSTNAFPEVSMQRFPYPPYIDDPLLPMLSNFIGLIIMLSFVYTCIGTVKVVTTEKEKQLKEVMKIMGLPNWLHWLAWFIKTFSYALVTVSLIVLLLKVQWYPGNNVSVFTKSNALVIFVFLLLYMCTTITFCFMISVFFSKANTASTIAGLAWFMSYAPYLFLQNRYDALNLVQKISACLASNTAMAYGFQFMLMYEGTGEGLQWWSIWRSVTPNDDFKLGYVMIMLAVDAVIYFLVALYVEAIYPGEYGVPMPWYFPFTYTYWCGYPRYVGIEDNAKQNGLADNDMYEKEPSNLPAGIRIKHLRKVFSNKKVAVRDLCLNMYEGQITVLLGHNGAGKTTTMLMLTGMFPPTTGTAVVAGHDIRSDMRGVRESLGLCPQHNILFDELTVKEHIYFYSKLKGLSASEIDAEIDKYIELLELVPKRNNQSHTLSGGMKRKLSVCVALCGKSKVVMLDEPTAGMDPAGRRALWDLLQVEKKDRTMLLTTHFMDEADLLGDRIAIMAGGTLQCVGSSFFLKKRYGAGYHLTMEKATQCDYTKVTDLLRKYIPNIQVESNVGSELSYLLSENLSPIFETMLHDLEENSAPLGILNYGISLTTMEEVFMKVGADHGQEEENNAREMHDKESTMDNAQVEVELNRHSSESKLNTGEKLLTGVSLYVNQFQAMMMKKIYSTLRTWILMVIQIIIPVSFLIIAIVVVRSWGATNNLPSLAINLDSYNLPYTVMNSQNSTDALADVYRAYKQSLVDRGRLYFDLGSSDVIDFILKTAQENLPLIRMKILAGASFLANNSVVGWFNNEAYHTAPLALNLIHNAVLRDLSNDTHRINVFNYPLPYTLDTRIRRLSQGNNIGFQIAFNIGFSMAFVSSFYILFIIRERVSKAKHLQFVSGVNVLIFWTTTYLWDMITFILTSMFLIVTLAAFQEEGFQTFSEIGRVFSVLLLFGYAMLPLTYLASFLFDIPSTGYTRITLFNIFTGVASFLVVEILGTPSLDLKNIADVLDWVFMLIPHYGLSSAVCNINNINVLNSLCALYTPSYRKLLCPSTPDYYAWKKPGIGRNMFFFGTIGTLLFALLIVIEYRIPERALYKIKKLDVPEPPDVVGEDEDVRNEKERVRSMSAAERANHCLVLRNFSKYYGKFLAVNKLSVAIRRSECFGLLGINGAGKTSTFKMLTGDEKISFGDAWVTGLSLKSDMKQVHQLIGYCPQFDALLDDLTGREILKIFCALRGVPSRESEYISERMAADLDFRRHIDKRVKQYSGGNKRKLSTAVALIGDPSVVYLDEPTTGMDPAAKRQLWNALCRVRDAGKCIVLTSHSMEECEALCTRLAIMVNGHFRCLGSTQRLKSRFSEGYTLMVKVRRDAADALDAHDADIEPIARFVHAHFPSAVLRERYQELLMYYIPERSMSWSQMFGVMEKSKTFLNIEDYSLGQTSLEQVFLQFTKHQRQSED